MFLSLECLIRRCHTGFSPKCVLSFYITKHINSVFSFGSVQVVSVEVHLGTEVNYSVRYCTRNLRSLPITALWLAALVNCSSYTPSGH